METTATLLREPEPMAMQRGMPGRTVAPAPDAGEDGLTHLARAHERERITHEVHEALADELVVIGQEIERALAHLNETPELARDQLLHAIAATRDGLNMARRSVLDLRGGLPAGRSVDGAIAELGRALSAETGMEVRVETSGARGLPFRVEVGLYRAVQAWLSNVREDPGVTKVRIELTTTATDALLSVWDNGLHHEAGLGEEREMPALLDEVRALGGTLAIRGEPAMGTHILIRVPQRSLGPRSAERNAGAIDAAGVSPA